MRAEPLLAGGTGPCLCNVLMFRVSICVQFVSFVTPLSTSTIIHFESSCQVLLHQCCDRGFGLGTTHEAMEGNGSGRREIDRKLQIRKSMGLPIIDDSRSAGGLQNFQGLHHRHPRLHQPWAPDVSKIQRDTWHHVFEEPPQIVTLQGLLLMEEILHHLSASIEEGYPYQLVQDSFHQQHHFKSFALRLSEIKRNS